MQGWHRAYPLSKAVEMVSKIDQTDRVHVLGEGFEVSGHPIEGTINATRGDVESYAQFQLAPLRDEEPITDEADRHAVRVNIFENADRSDLSAALNRCKALEFTA